MPRYTIKEALIMSEAILTIQSDLNLSDGELSNILGLSVNNLMKRKESKSLFTLYDENAFTQAVLLGHLYLGLCAVLGDNIDALRYWLSADNIYLRDRPLRLMQKENGLSTIVNYLEFFRSRWS
jgi:hypothetical protein